ncbi:MAG TPA: GNAT family N-acetyltransferase [Devosia sp.]|nr:GNAT family N-acetyltransferase [Devosia sp.]
MAATPDFSYIGKIENGLLANRPSLESVYEGAWVWRFANGFTRRANSLQSLDRDDDAGFEKRLDIHWQRSRQRGIEPVFRVTPLTPPKVIEFLLGEGFERQGNTRVMVRDANIADKAAQQTELQDLAIVAHRVSDPLWQKQILVLENIGEKDADTFIQMLEKLPQSAVGLSLVQRDGGVIGVAYASCHNGIGSVFALEVVPGQRGKGFGRLLMNYMHGWLKDNGARQLALQVVVENSVALRLYQSFGYEEKYRYYYLVGKK